MLLRIHLPPEFRAWRIVCLVTSIPLVLVALRFFRGLQDASELADAMTGALVSMGLFVAAGVAAGLGLSGYLSRPSAKLFGSILYPEETIKEAPKELLFALRMRLRNRYWESVDQQTRALLDAYGPSPELYHLRALMEAGRGGNHAAVTVVASQKLSRRAFDRYMDLLRNDPPSHPIKTGIDA